MDNLRAFTGGWKSVAQESHGDVILNCVDVDSCSKRPGGDWGGGCRMEDSQEMPSIMEDASEAGEKNPVEVKVLSI